MLLHQCKNFENLLTFDKVTESLKVGTFFETQCRLAITLAPVFVVLRAVAARITLAYLCVTVTVHHTVCGCMVSVMSHFPAVMHFCLYCC